MSTSVEAAVRETVTHTPLTINANKTHSERAMIESGELSECVVKIQWQAQGDQLLLRLTVPNQTVSIQHEAVEPQETPYCSEEKDTPGDKNGNRTILRGVSILERSM